MWVHGGGWEHLGCHRTHGTPEGAHACTYPVRTVRGGADGPSCPAPHVRTVRRRPARVAGAQSTGAPGRTSQLRRAQQLAQLRLAVLGDEGLLADDLVDDHLEVALGRQLQQVHRLVAHLTALLVLEDDAWRVVPQQEAAQLHLTRLVGSPATPWERGGLRSGQHGWITGCVRPRCARARTARHPHTACCTRRRQGPAISGARPKIWPAQVDQLPRGAARAKSRHCHACSSRAGRLHLFSSPSTANAPIGEFGLLLYGRT